MMIHIGRAGSRLGAFPEEEVRQGLVTGRFSMTDLGWKEGMANWAPLSQFSEFSSPPEPVPPALPDDLEIPEIAAPAGLPWDDRKERGFFPAFLETVRIVLANPSGAFARMRTGGSLLNPLLYNLIGGWIGLIAYGIYLVLTARMEPPPGNPTQLQALFYMTPARAVQELKFFLFMGPFVVTAVALICAGIIHLFLMLAGGAKKPYHVTLRVFCFSYGSSQLLQVFPFCGNVLAPVWMLVCCMVGLAGAHGTTTGRSMTAVVLFVAICFACCLGSLFLALGGGNLRPLFNQ